MNFHMFKYINIKCTIRNNIFLISSNSYHLKKIICKLEKIVLRHKMYLKYTYIFLVQYRILHYCVITHLYLHYRIFILHSI